MHKADIKKLLHQREPYLLIDKVLFLNEIVIQAQKKLIGDEFFLKGHFPGAPILPGAMMQEMTTQSAGLLITKFYAPVNEYQSEKTKGYALGVLKKVNYAKFKSFAKPGDLLEVQVTLKNKLENLFEFDGVILKGEKVIMKNSFQLINISDEHLY